MTQTNDPILQTVLAGLALRNPVMLAAGTHGTLDEVNDVCPLSHLGGLMSKSITREPRGGNPLWRILDAQAGMLNAIGLANPGIDVFEEQYLPRAKDMDTAVFISVAGSSVEDYVAVASSIDEVGTEHGVVGIELNVSCPNVKTGTEFGMSPASIREVLEPVREVVKHGKLFVKLSPITPDIAVVARAAIEAGVDGLTMGNTIPAMAIDVHTRKPRLSNVTGGFSGPGLHPVAVRLVHEVYTKVARDAGVPIIGTGGVMRWEDAAEFILAGATAVQVGTAMFANPKTPIKVAQGLAKWAKSQGVNRIGDLVGQIDLNR